MGTDYVVVLAFSLVILILFAVIIVDYIAPMFLKTRFDDLCRHYLLIAEANNGLSKRHRQSLKEELEKMGLRDIKITVDEQDTISRRKEYLLKVECKYSMNIMKQVWVRNAEEFVFKFENGFLARRIVE